MHFEQSLKRAIYPPWRDQYIDYSKLKRLLREKSSDAGSPGDDEDEWTEDDEDKFVDELINHQLDKVAHFHANTIQKLRDRASSSEARLEPIVAAVQHEEEAGKDVSQGPSRPQAAGRITLQEVMQELDGITKEINALEKYARINYTGFMKAAKKHDRKRGQAYRVRPFLQVRLADLPFSKEDYSPLLFRLSSMYSFVRQQLHGRENRASISESRQGTEEYTSYKCMELESGRPAT